MEQEEPRVHHRRKFTEGLIDTDRILASLDIEHGQTVLDAGCGTGYFSRLLSDEVGENGMVYAVDRNENGFEALRSGPALANVKLVVADFTKDIPIAKGSVDVFYLSTALHLQSGGLVQGLIREIKRVLRPGGTLAIVEIEKREMNFGPPMHLRRTPAELIAAMPFQPVETVKVSEHFYLQVFRNGCHGTEEGVS